MAIPEHVSQFEQGADAWNAWRVQLRKESTTWAPDLRGLDLRGRDLRAYDFINVRLYNANLRAAKLYGMNLNGVHLSGADLTGANLSGCTFWTTILGRANLTDANLVGAEFLQTDLWETDFSGSTVGGTIFGAVDLSTAIGLDAVKHAGPSTIGIDTLYQSSGKIPDVFLRGAGIPDDFIAYVASLVSQPIEFYSCFISYSHADKPFARRLHDILQGRGIRCWLDEHQLLPGDNIYDEIDRGILIWDKVLLCASEKSLNSWWVDNEITIAFAKEQALWRERGKHVLALIPLDLDGYLLHGWQDGKAQQIKTRLAADFTGWEKDNDKFETEVARVIQALRADENAREQPPQPKI
jgi:uncharacterized protein YjbI with pentapeptide repeats